MGETTPTGSSLGRSMATVVVVEDGNVAGATVPVVGTVSTGVPDSTVIIESVVSDAVIAVQDAITIAQVDSRATDREFTIATLA
ncbi:MAG: hypothetical protein WBM90_06185 [Acidimicrobiia bacterium]